MFKQPFSFDGRIRRTEYGLSYLLYMFAAFLMGFLSGMAEVLETVLLISYIPMIWFMLAQGAKRCHDLGHSGWYQLIPFYNIWMVFGPGEEGPNRYGADPKAIEYHSVSDILDDEIV